jgi:PiT family inorganic phosphate transporter
VEGPFYFLLPALLLGWALGSNDAANVFGPAVTTGTLRFWLAAGLAALLVIGGAVLQGQKGLATYGALTAPTPVSAALLSLAAALTVAGFTALGLPVSTTQTVAGALVGFGLMRTGLAGVDWNILLKLLVAWTLAPLGAGVLAYLLYRLSERALEPWLRGLTAYDRLIAFGFLFLTAYGAYSLGANNVANVTGAYVGSGLLTPRLGALLGGLGIAVGMLIGSRRVVLTVGARLTQLTPFNGLIVLITEALVLHLYAIFGVPVSASQAIVGGVIGVGLVKGMWTVNRALVVRIGISWFAAPLIGAGLAALLGLIVRP